MFNSAKNLHFIGIGGSGISALAHLARQENRDVSGSDVAENETLNQLRSEGVQIYVGHDKNHLNQAAELVIYSQAIDLSNNPEYLEAKARNLPTMSYFEALGELSKQKKTVVVTGTHGKTTTTAMLGQSLIELGLDPTVIVGSRVPYFGDRNLHVGKSEWFIVEGCEYRENFSSLEPFGMILLNCEWEHVDYFKSEKDYLKAFEKLAKKLPKNGFFIFNAEDKNAQQIAQQIDAQAIGIKNGDHEAIHLQIPGEFNRMNAAHALKTCEKLGFKESDILKTLANFKGTHRRMEVKGEKDGILVIDDYAHHPTEIKATLRALKEKYPEKRLICIFQPHQYSRTYEFLEGFKQAFGEADQVIIPNIYEARDTEVDKAKISAKELAEMIPNTQWGEDFDKTIQHLKEQLQEGDLLVTMGAGDVYQVGERFLAG